MAQRLLQKRPEAVFVVIVPIYNGYLGKIIENIYGPYTESGAKSALKSESRSHKDVRIERAATTWEAAE